MEKKLLVIDDELSIGKFIQLVLAKKNISVEIFDSGYKAFLKLERDFETKGKIDYLGILCDYKMPGWDGLQVLTEIRKRPYFSIPFVLMTGKLNKDQIEQASSQEADGIIFKPIKEEDLIEKLSKTIFKKETA